MNKSIMMGRLVRDPEIHYSQRGDEDLAVANFRIAVDRKYAKDGETKADFFSCTAFSRYAEFAEKYLVQGLKIVVTGRMQNDNYTNRDGNKVYSMRLMVEDIDFAESKKAFEAGRAKADDKERDREDDREDGRERPRQSKARTPNKRSSRSQGRSEEPGKNSSRSSGRNQGGYSDVDEDFDSMEDEYRDFD